VIDETLVHSEVATRPDPAIDYGLDGKTLQRLESMPYCGSAGPESGRPGRPEHASAAAEEAL
jgi:hypothetical protein